MGTEITTAVQYGAVGLCALLIGALIYVIKIGAKLLEANSAALSGVAEAIKNNTVVLQKATDQVEAQGDRTSEKLDDLKSQCKEAKPSPSHS